MIRRIPNATKYIQKQYNEEDEISWAELIDSIYPYDIYIHTYMDGCIAPCNHGGRTRPPKPIQLTVLFNIGNDADVDMVVEVEMIGIGVVDGDVGDGDANDGSNGDDDDDDGDDGDDVDDGQKLRGIMIPPCWSPSEYVPPNRDNGVV
jgi:hypothetical protein